MRFRMIYNLTPSTVFISEDCLSSRLRREKTATPIFGELMGEVAIPIPIAIGTFGTDSKKN